MKTCSDCPFVKSSPLVGSHEWLEDIIKIGARDPYFKHSCHKTDPNADGYVGGKKKRECKGHMKMMFNEMDGTPGKGGVYDNRKHLILTYLKHWLGENEFLRIEQGAK